MVKDKKGLKDPVEEKNEKREEAQLTEEMKSLAVGEQEPEDDGFLSMDEIGAVQARRTSAPHPFDGYRLGRKVPVGENGDLAISSTYLVLLKPTAQPAEDASNKGQTIYVSKTPGGGGSPTAPGSVAKVVDYPTSHTRVVINRQGNQNESVVFDREILVSGQWYKCAIVRSHAARAQIIFKFDEKRGRSVPDERYMLADTRQAQPLLRMFEAIYHQRTKAERAAREFDAAQETTAADRPLA